MGLKRVLSIAGSDSGGGAGIQADLKTFAAYGVHGMTAVTAITAQNTLGVTAIQGVDPSIIEAQIRAVVSDIGVDTVKVGMLHDEPTIEVVSRLLEEYGLRAVVDPVMVAASGAELLKPEAREALVERLVPLAEVLTPNRYEAEKLSGLSISNVGEAAEAAEAIASLGCGAVLVKGGHLGEGEEAVDVLYYGGEARVYRGPYHKTRNTHGTGCSLSSAIAAELALGRSIPQAVEGAKRFVNQGIKYSLDLGSGPGPVNPLAGLWMDADRFRVLEEVGRGVSILEGEPRLSGLVAECQMNLGMAVKGAQEPGDVCAVEGRITRRLDGVKASGCPRFGVSRHICSTILALMELDESKRAALNLRYDEGVLRVCREMGLLVSFYDRREEPEEVKAQEGMTTRWGSKEAARRVGRVPDVIYHLGDWGKEPMVLLIGESATQVAQRAVEIARRL